MSSREFEGRRRQLMKMIGREGIAILPAAPVRLRNGNVEHAYRQDSRFYYITGFEEPEAVAVLVPGRTQAEYVLFVRDRDPQREAWDGSRAGPEGAIRTFGADDAFPISDIDEILPGLMEARSRVYYTMGVNLEFDPKVVGWVNTLRAQSRQGAQVPQEFVALDHVLDDMRLYKSRDELAKMREAAEISVAAHRRAMRFTRPGKMEFEVVAEIAHEFMSRNATMAYQPIVGGGPNACTLHYRDNNARLKDGELLLIDAGCEYASYASDVTRTFPVNGRYSPEQRAIYELVLAAQHAAIAKVRPGNHWSEPHDAAVRVITAGLVKLKLLKGRLPKLIKDGAYREFFMHRTGHWIGLDVHDVGDYKVGEQWRVLEPGMTLTVEPGIYIRPSNRVPKRFWNIGVRIEDDVAVTRAGAEVLSGGLETDPDAIEKLMAAA
jgi:Xaa-Pro aminopeptidase